MEQHCKDCGMPMEQDGEACSCNESLCVHCCACGGSCGCGCGEK